MIARAMSNFVIDGSVLEGGGQILRKRCFSFCPSLEADNYSENSEQQEASRTEKSTIGQVCVTQ